MIGFFWNILFFLILVSTAFAQDHNQVMDGDDLRKLLNPSEREHYEHSKEIKSDEMHLLLKRRKEREAAEKAAREAAERAAREAAERTARENSNGRSKGGDPAMTGTSGKGGENNASGASAGKNGQAVGSSDLLGPDGKRKSSASITKGKGRGHKGRAANGNGNGKYGGSGIGRGGDRYIPPSWAQCGKTKVGGFQTDGRKKKKGPYFGIRMGTKIRAHLPQVTTNVEQNLTEIVIKQDVYGDFKTMPRGTKLFAKKSLNSGSNRLELLAVKGITPQGEEFTLKGIVLDINNSAGLVGAVSTDGKAVHRSIAAGVFGLGKEIAPLLNDGSVIGSGVEAAAKNIMDEKKDETEQSLNDPQYIIYVNPQDIKIRVEETF